MILEYLDMEILLIDLLNFVFKRKNQKEELYGYGDNQIQENLHY